ncbi:MAG: hypothetical protein F4049_15255 [Gemmatimonadetes bacterium]|nr:hypothetical protein [Gemmatimonadota bacterium]
MDLDYDALIEEIVNKIVNEEDPVVFTATLQIGVGHRKEIQKIELTPERLKTLLEEEDAKKSLLREVLEKKGKNSITGIAQNCDIHLADFYKKPS